MADESDFEPRLGRMRHQGGKRARSYLGRVIAAANLARGGAARRSDRRASFTGSRVGRGAGVGAVLGGRGAPGAHRRRVIVKASVVKLAGKGAGAAAAHLRYLQRDGTTRDGERGALYAAESDAADGKAFHARGTGDGHQFRFIVSPEDGAQYDDLKPLTRRLLARVEADLGTTLDWVAIDHFNTGHPHTHILVRGKDHLGADLVIARDYLTAGIRERAAELVELDLGPRSDREIEAAVRSEVEQHRLTGIDRAMLRDAKAHCILAAQSRNPADQAIRLGRLATLGRLGLAEPIGGGMWRLAPDLDAVLTRLGERDDIVRTMQRALTARGLERASAERSIYDPAAPGARPLIGRIAARGLADEHGDRHYLIIDAVDGRSHYVAAGRAEAIEPLPDGAIVRIDPVRAGPRQVDETIARVAAANGGRYDIETHLRYDPHATPAFAESHQRRLEAIRRATGGATRDPEGHWQIAADHLDRVNDYEKARLRDHPVALELLSPVPVAQLAAADAATWLDRELTSIDPLPLREAGFGGDVRRALALRREWLVGMGLAEEADGTIAFRPGLLGALGRRELVRTADRLARELSLPFAEARDGEAIGGVVRRRIDLISGRFALIERSHDFTLVPWRPVLEPHIGKQAAGILRGDRVSWTLSRGRAGPVIG